MNYINRKDNGTYISGTEAAYIRPGQVRIFDSFKKAYDFCRSNSIDPDKIVAKYKTYKVET